MPALARHCQHHHQARIQKRQTLCCCLAAFLQVADGHHQHHVSELVCEELEETLRAAVGEKPNLEDALVRGWESRVHSADIGWASRLVWGCWKGMPRCCLRCLLRLMS